MAQIIDIKEKRDIPVSERATVFDLQESCRNTRSSRNGHLREFDFPETDRTKFILLRQLELVNNSVRPPRDKFDNVSEATKEVIMTCSMKWYPLKEINSCAAIAFVHHLQSIQDGDWPCSGQLNTFFIQKRRHDSGAIELIN